MTSLLKGGVRLAGWFGRQGKRRTRTGQLVQRPADSSGQEQAGQEVAAELARMTSLGRYCLMRKYAARVGPSPASSWRTDSPKDSRTDSDLVPILFSQPPPSPVFLPVVGVPSSSSSTTSTPSSTMPDASGPSSSLSRRNSGRYPFCPLLIHSLRCDCLVICLEQ